MSADARFEPERVVARLNDDGVRYVVVEGLAVGAHGVIRATRDIDLVPDPQPANLSRLASALVALGGSHPIEADLSGASLARPRSIKVPTRYGEVHVLNRMPGTPPFDDLERARIVVEIDDGIGAPVCSLPHLRRMKRASAIYAEVQKRGAVIDYTIYDAPHGFREFGVQDPDGHDIAFGQRLVS